MNSIGYHSVFYLASQLSGFCSGDHFLREHILLRIKKYSKGGLDVRYTDKCSKSSLLMLEY